MQGKLEAVLLLCGKGAPIDLGREEKGRAGQGTEGQGRSVGFIT